MREPNLDEEVVYVSRYRVEWRGAVIAKAPGDPFTVSLDIPDYGRVVGVEYDEAGQPNTWHYQEEAA